MPDEQLPRRALRTAFWLCAWFVFLFGVRGQSDVSVGLAIGGALGLMSLWTFTVAVPSLLGPNSRRGTWLLAGLLVLKVPLYCVTLNYAMSSPLISGMAVFAGVALVPAVIALKVVGHLVVGGPHVHKESTSCPQTNTDNR